MHTFTTRETMCLIFPVSMVAVDATPLLRPIMTAYGLSIWGADEYRNSILNSF